MTPEVGAEVSLDGTLGYSSGSDPDGWSFGCLFGLAPTATASGRAGSQIQPIASKEFYSGLLQPIGVAQFQYYFESGYPQGLVIALLVENVDVNRQNQKRCFVRNDPLDSDRVAVFTNMVNQLLDLEPYIEVKKGKTTPLNASIPVSAAGVLQGIAEAEAAGLELTPAAGGVVVSNVGRRSCACATRRGGRCSPPQTRTRRRPRRRASS